jgi:hypothetical protein
VEHDEGAEKSSRHGSSSGKNVRLSVWSHKGPAFFPGLRSDSFWTGLNSGFCYNLLMTKMFEIPLRVWFDPHMKHKTT